MVDPKNPNPASQPAQPQPAKPAVRKPSDAQRERDARRDQPKPGESDADHDGRHGHVDGEHDDAPVDPALPQGRVNVTDMGPPPEGVRDVAPRHPEPEHR